MSHRHASSDIDHLLAERLDSVWGDPATWVANGLQWTHLPAVSGHVHAQVSGDPSISPIEWFFSVVNKEQSTPVARALVLGCGQGHVERQIAEYGWANQIIATDLSAKVLDVARANAAAVGASIEYVQADMNCLAVGYPSFEPGSFDVVLGVSCVHHCADLEHLYASILKLLTPSGWLFLDEYVGPNRFQYPNSQVRFMNQLLDILPERLRKTRDDRIKGNLWRPSAEEVVAVDPSEAVRSCDILPLLDRHFDIYEHRPYGGALLRVVLADIAQNFKDKAVEPYLQSLLKAEDDLFRTGRLQRDLACVIARVPSAASTPSTEDR